MNIGGKQILLMINCGLFRTESCGKVGMKKLLLWKEQGIGDDILFLGLVLEAYRRSKFLTVYTDSRLISLCERGMPGVVFNPYKNKIDDEDFDYPYRWGACLDYSAAILKILRILLLVI